MSTTATGAFTVWLYRWEDSGSYNQTPGAISDTTDKIFGINETMDTQDRENNAERQYRPFSRNAEDIIETQFDGSWSGDFTLTNSWWFQFFFGEPTITEIVSGSEYEHFYETDPRNPPKTAHVIEETHYPNGEVEQVVYTGCVASTVDLEFSVEDTVSVSLDGFYAQDHSFLGSNNNIPYGDSANGLASQPDTSYRAMHFGNSILRMDVDDDSTAEDLRLIQDASVSLEGNAEGEYELGSRIVGAPSFLNYEPDVDYTQLVGLDIDRGERLASYGSQTAQTQQETMDQAAIEGEIEVDNGLALTEQNPVLLEMFGSFPDSFTRNNVGDPQEALEQDIGRLINDVQVTVTSDQNTAP